MLKKLITASFLVALGASAQAIAGEKDDDASFAAANKRFIMANNEEKAPPQEMKKEQVAKQLATADIDPGTQNPGQDKPLMVIRFNQNYVHYDTPLYQAVKKTLEVNPNAKFDVVSFYPESGDSRADEKSQKEAERKSDQMAKSFAKIGVPESQAKFSSSPSKRVSSNEVQIFVQ